MVDRQTPTVEADAETEQEAQEARSGGVTPSKPPEADREVAPDRPRAKEPEAGLDAREEASVKRTIREEASPADAQPNAALFDQDAAQGFQERWITIQTEFVDEPGAAVKKAEALVAEVVDQLTSSFAREREALESRWSGHDDVSTEDLRQAIRRYRSFFNRLLAI